VICPHCEAVVPLPEAVWCVTCWDCGKVRWTGMPDGVLWVAVPRTINGVTKTYIEQVHG
jgi:hypothetical protein